MRAILMPLSLLLLGAAGPAIAKEKAVGRIVDASGVAHGSIMLREQHGMLHGVVRVSGLAPGRHGMHIHGTGQCGGVGFADAGGHWNPDNKQHGLENPLGSHRGDLKDLQIGRNGTGIAHIMLMGSLDSVLDADGAALIVHANPDDGKSEPSGNSGPRLYCAVLQRAY